MPFHKDAFCRGIALTLQGESMKAGAYVTHNGLLGTLRERIVTKLVQHETPDRFRVECGLIRHHGQNLTSRQCDLLIHETQNQTPFYRYEDFVIVSVEAARAAIEVKSDLDRQGFEDLLEIHSSVTNVALQVPVCIPVLGYGLTGATVSTLADCCREALTADRLRACGHEGPTARNWPVCIAVQDRSIIGIRPLYPSSGDAPYRDYCFCLADLSTADQSLHPVNGIETGFFLHFYSLLIQDKRDHLDWNAVYQWFNGLPLPANGKTWVDSNGTVHSGNVTTP